MPPKFSQITTEDFDRILCEILAEEETETLLSVPGIYEILSEHLNNEVLERWEQEQV